MPTILRDTQKDCGKRSSMREVCKGDVRSIGAGSLYQLLL
jgi:hypothetical protein